MKKTVKFLRGIQWSSGELGYENKGQCPFCYGACKECLELFGYTIKDYGHRKGCELAEAMEDLGIRVDYIKEFK